MNEGESVDDAAHQCNRRRHEAGCSEDHPDEEYVLGHASSVGEKRAHVQAVVLMPHLRNLWGTRTVSAWFWPMIVAYLRGRTGTCGTPEPAPEAPDPLGMQAGTPA